MKLYRGTVARSRGPEWKDVTIPALYRDGIVAGVRSAVDAQEGDEVLVAKLATSSRSNVWHVIGFESVVGRLGAPYPHDHPMSQVEGLSDRLAAIEKRLDDAGL